ncbi:MAG: TldD/PmbA family protein [Oscillospiraceae bacterium]|nr:TldD/PmbA family protein [Oscillospiraceae bacterium]
MNTEVIKNAVAEAAERFGAEHYEINIVTEESASAEALNKEVSTVSYSRSSRMQLRCVVDGKSGYAMSELVTPEAAFQAVEAACGNALCVDDPDEMPLFGGSASYQQISDPIPELPSAEELKAMALELQELTYAASDKIVDGSQSQVSGVRESHVMINSEGLDLSHTFGMVYRVAMAAVKDSREGAEDSADEYVIANVEKETAAESVNKAVTGALNNLWGEPVPSGKYNVIMDAPTVSSLLRVYSVVFSARNAYLGTTLLAGKEGQKIASETFTLMDDPFHPEKTDHRPFDGEGVAAYAKTVVDKGVLNTLLYNRMYAKLLGRQTTGNARDAKNIAPTGLYLAPGAYSEEALLERLGNGLYITSLQGLHAGANTQSGDFSLQATGFVVENGKKTRPVKNITLADNFYQLMCKVDALSDKVKFSVASPVGAPEVLFTDISVSGK